MSVLAAKLLMPSSSRYSVKNTMACQGMVPRMPCRQTHPSCDWLASNLSATLLTDD